MQHVKFSVLLQVLMSEKNLTRINKYLSEIGYCSRRAADKLIEQGRVSINGKVTEMGTKISDEDEVHVNGELVAQLQKKMEEPGRHSHHNLWWQQELS